MVFHQDLLTNFDRITQSATDFIRGNPIVSTAAIGAGFTGLTALAVTQVRRKAKRKATKKRRKTTKKRKCPRKKTVKKRTRSGLSKARKQKIKFTKKGQPYVITRSGKARFIKRAVAKRAKARRGGFS